MTVGQQEDGGRVGDHAADARLTAQRPGRRPLRLHAALRPRTVRGARAGGRARRAGDEPLRLRRRAGRGGLCGAGGVLPLGSGRGGLAHAARREACPARAGHAAPCRAMRGAADVVHFQWLTVQPLDVHLLPRKRPLVLDRPRRAAARAAPGPAEARSAACTSAPTRSSSTRSTAPPACATSWGSTPRASTRSRTARSTASPRSPIPRRCRPSWRRSSGRSCCASG